MTRFITIPPFVLPRFTWLVYLLLWVRLSRDSQSIAQQGARQAACSTTYHVYENHFHKDSTSNEKEISHGMVSWQASSRSFD
jgi:hypothetical protein